MKSNLLVLLIVVICVAGAAYHFHPEYFKPLSPTTTASASTTTGTVTATTTTSPTSSGTETVSTPATVTPTPAPRVFTPPNPLPQKDDWTWTTSDGKTYSKVKILKVEADCVTVLDSDGGARVDISTLPADLQAMLNYDPELAQAAALERKGPDKTPAAPASPPAPIAPVAPAVPSNGPLSIMETDKDSSLPRKKLEQQLDDLRADIKLKEKELLDNQTAEANGTMFLGDTREAIKKEKIQEQALVDKLAGH